MLDDSLRTYSRWRRPKTSKMIEELAPGCSHPFGEGGRPRRPTGQPDDLHTLAPEDLVEASSELGVPIAEEEAGLDLAILD